MKATFFTLATMAASAFAAPQGLPVVDDILGGVSPPGAQGTGTPAVPETPEVPAGGLGDVLGGLGSKKARQAPEVPAGGLGDVVGDVLGGLGGSKEARQAPELPSDLGGIDGLVELITGLTDQLKGGFGNIDDITNQVDSGDISADEAEPQVLDELDNIKLNIKDIVTQVTDQAGIPVADGDVQRVLTVVQTLLDVVLANVKTLLTVLGLRPQLISVLHSVFTLLANLLTAVTGLVVGLLPALIGGLSPLLAGLSPVLQGIVSPVAVILAGVSGV